MTRTARRPATWYRLLISLWGVWFATVLTEPAGLMACPQHSGHGAQHAAAPSHVATHAAHQQNAPAAGHASAHGSAGHDAHATRVADEQPQNTGGNQCCTCLGQCCAAAPAAAVDATPTFAVGLVRTVVPFASVHTATHTPRRAYALPFANGPPARV